MKTLFAIGGMHCEACTNRLGDAFQKIPGVLAARVSLQPPQAEIESTEAVALETMQAAARAAGDYAVTQASSSQVQEPGGKKPSLYPLFLVLGYITATTTLLHFARGEGSLASFLHDFMGAFFLAFSFFKLLDLRGFADAYSSYDLLARRSRTWAFAYPFVELALAAAYFLRWQLALVNSATLLLMLFGGLGVLQALRRKESIRCACLGTALNLPMTTVTLVEDFGMAAMAGAMLAWSG